MNATIRAATSQLAIIRAYLTEAIRMGEVFRTDGDRAAVRCIAYQLLAVEQSLFDGGIEKLAPEKLAPEKLPESLGRDPRVVEFEMGQDG